MSANGYPVQLTIEYPDRPLNRLTSALRIFTAIPILILLCVLSGSKGAGLLFLAPLLMILFQQKYPRWWFDWNLDLLAFTNRVGAYCFLLTDVYPATDEEQAVHLELPYPDAKNGLNRWLPLVKWLLAIPHYIVLFFLWVGLIVAVIVAWFAILFTGRYPRGLFDYVVGVARWGTRVTAYAFILTTDEYPPFRLAP